MPEKQNYGGLDAFRLIAALLVVAIHISPLETINPEADFLLTRVAARLAVPFFLLVTGRFVLSGVYAGETAAGSAVRRSCKKLLGMYAAAALLYLPIGMYAGHYDGLSFGGLLRMLVFDGTFYHLWYFPACLLGILLLCLLRRFLPARGVWAIAVILYLIGLFGDSYYGLTANVPALEIAYESGFSLFSYTRNGLFLAPVFLWMGAASAKMEPPKNALPNAACLLVSLLLMTDEAFTLRYFQLQRHDSMYLMLPVCVFFLYRLLLLWKVRPPQSIRRIAMWIYILHPAVIVAVRGAAKLFNRTDLLVENRLVHYLLVCLLSTAAAWLLTYCLNALHKRPTSPDRAWVEIDRAALRHNVETLRALLPKDCALMPAVKANAYGHGAVPVAKELNRLGIRAFCVACISEGIELRRHSVKGEILILGYTHPSRFHELRRYRLTQAVIDCDYAEILNQYGKKLHVHVAIDTGMHRLGERSEDTERLYALPGMRNLIIDGAFTHLCAGSSEAPEDRQFTLQQAERFDHVLDAWKLQGFDCPRVHVQASSGILNYPELVGSYARPGIALYGLLSREHDCNRAGAVLQPMLTLKARVAAVKELQAGESAGYNRAFQAEQPTKIAILSIGYADGLPRTIPGGAVLLRGRRAAIAGPLCMDQMIVDVSGIPDVQPGDTAVLIGRSEEAEITAYELAEACGTITNELLSRLGPRLERVYI